MQTATNPQTGEKLVLQNGQWVPVGGAAPGVMTVGTPRPKAPAPQTPDQAAYDASNAEYKQYQTQSQPIYDRSNAIDKVRDGYRQDKRVLKYEQAIPVYISGLQSEGNPAGDLLLVNAFSKVNDPDTGVQQREGDQAASAQPATEQLKAQLLKQFGDDGYGNFTPEGRKRMREAMTVRMRQLADQYRQTRAEHVNYIKSLGLPNTDPETIIGPFAGLPFQKAEEAYQGRGLMLGGKQVTPGPNGQPIDPAGTGDIGFNQSAQPNNPLSPQQQAAYDLFWQTHPNATVEQVQAFGASIGADINNAQAIIDAKNAGAGVQPGSTAVLKPRESIQDRADRVVDKSNTAAGAFGRGAADTLSMGAFDELNATGAALGDMLSGEQGGFSQLYNENVAALGGADSRIQADHPVAYPVGQVAGALALPSFGAKSAGQMAAVGAGYGGAYGFGSGEGGIGDRTLSALGGAAAGAATGYAIPKAIELGKKGVVAAGRKMAGDISPEQRAILDAGNAENVPINMSDVFPETLNTVATLEAIPGASGPVRRGIEAGRDAIQGRVNDLAKGGTALEPNVGGQAVQRTADNFIQTSGTRLGKQYDALEKASAGVKVPPVKSAQVVDDVIAKLSETPESNAKEIAFLNTLKSDFQNDLSIGALRRVRTSLRKKISKGELTFGEDEASVLSIMDAASQDIANGLAAQGKRGVATQFAKTDAAYRERMQFIQGTVQKLVGKRGQNLPPEQVFNNLKSLASPRGDSSGLGKFLDEMAPDDRLDISATFADALGKNNKGEFSVAHLATQIEKMPKAVRTRVFGADGAKSLENLLILSKAKNGTIGRLNNNRSGQVSNYRTVLSSVLFGLPGGGALLGLAQAATVGAGAAGAVSGAAIAGTGLAVARGVSKVLMNEQFTRLLASAPATASPKAINAHIGKMRALAAKDPNIRSFVENLEKQLLSVANDNMARTGQVAASPNQGPAQQQQPE